MPNHNYLPSSANNPDLEWSQVRETVLMLNLAMAQIGNAMKDGDESINTLTESFTTMMDNMAKIHAACDALPASPARAAIMENDNAASERIQAVIVAFQFYDKLSQRLTHLTDSLAALAELVATPEQLHNPHAWRGLQDMIKSKYTVEADRAMFEAILQGKTVTEAIRLAAQHPAAKPVDDIELF